MTLRKQKLAVVFIGLVIAILLLEISLRIASNILVMNRTLPLARGYSKNNFNIVCIGDSFTFGLGADKGDDYPSQLQRILNDRYPQLNIQVINEGLLSGTSSLALKECDRIIGAYNPKICIILIGTTDPYNMEGINLGCMQRPPLYIKIDSYLSNLAVYKLAKYLAFNIANKLNLNRIKNNGYSPQRILKRNRNQAVIMSYDKRLQQLQRMKKETAALLKNRKFNRAIPLLEQILKEDKYDPDIYFGLGWAYRDCGRLSDAESILRKGIALFPEDDILYQKLGNCLLSRGAFKEAMVALKKAVEFNPDNQLALDELFDVYIRSGVYDERIENLLKMDKSFAILLEEKKSRDHHSYREDFIKEIFLCNIKKITRKIKKSNVIPVFVNYPIRWKWFDDQLAQFCRRENILFIDMHEAFDREIQKTGWDSLFIIDGHCNSRGYRLIAQVIGDGLSSEIKHLPKDGSIMTIKKED